MYLLSYSPLSLLLSELFVSISSWLGQGWDPVAAASLPLITHSTAPDECRGQDQAASAAELLMR